MSAPNGSGVPHEPAEMEPSTGHVVIQVRRPVQIQVTLPSRIEVHDGPMQAVGALQAGHKEAVDLAQ
jgi:hypothetical protein